MPRWMVPEWPVPVRVRALSTLRVGGVSRDRYHSLNLGAHVGDESTRVAENRRRLIGEAELPSEPVWLNQVHGRVAVDLDAGLAGSATHRAPSEAGSDVRSMPANPPPTADAAFTRRAGCVCAILTADCIPILLASESGDGVGAAHAGWRGLATGVIEAAVRAMGVPPERLLAWLGPAIGPEHFEVGAEVREALLGADPGAEAAFVPNARGRFMADLSALARRRLAALGVRRIHGADACTFANADRFFSHRRDGVTGRQATLIWLEP